MTLNETFQFLETQLTTRRLQELSRSLIEAYKQKKENLLKLYGTALFGKETEDSGNKLFLKLIKYFHPDRLAYLKQEVHKAFQTNDIKRLSFFKRLVSADEDVRKAHNKRYEMDYTEVYTYGEEDFGYDREDFHEEDLQEENVEFDFISAVKAEYMGNLDIPLYPGDLTTFEGAMDLSGYGIKDLEGLEYCRHISSLNLSDNEISDIYEIRNLDFLQELFLSENHLTDIDWLKGLSNISLLDLAYNEIDDITPLLTMESLRFVNLTGNPVTDKEIIKKLEERDVVIIL